MPKCRKKDPRGRPELPPELRKVSLSTRVPSAVLNGFIARAQAHGVDSRGVARSSVALEVERAFYATESPSATCPLSPLSFPPA